MPVWRDIRYVFFTPNQGGLEMSFATDAARANAPLDVDWPLWQDAKRAFLGWSTLQTDGQYNFISREVPMPLPGVTNFFRPNYLVLKNPQLPLWLFAVSVPRVEGIGPRGAEPSGLPLYETARLHTTFTNVTYQILEDSHSALLGDLGPNPDEGTLKRYVSGPYWKPSQRQVTLRRALPRSVPLIGDPAIAPPPSPATFEPTPPWPADTPTFLRNRLTEGLGTPEPGAEITYLWHQIPEDAFPIAAIMNCMGKVNVAKFDIFPAETLMMESPDVTPRTSPIGQRILDIQYRFKFLPRSARYDPDIKTARGWNWLLTYIKKSVPYYDYRKYTLTGQDDGAPAFRTADFKALFRPDQPTP